MSHPAAQSCAATSTAPPVIETRHRQGYRFVAEVTVLAQAPALTPGDTVLFQAAAGAVPPVFSDVPIPSAPVHSAPLPAPAARPTALGVERRQLTVLFCDLVDSSTLAGQLDPEDLRAVMGRYHAACTAVIERYGGYVVYMLAGRVTDAILLLTQAVEQTLVAGMIYCQTFCYNSLSEAHRLAGRFEDAQTLAERALVLTRERQERGDQAYALRLLGDIAVWREPPDVALAEVHYQHALALAEDLGMRPLQAHCHHSLGALYVQTGRAALAHAALSTAIAMYRAMDMTFWLSQAEAVLAQGKGL